MTGGGGVPCSISIVKNCISFTKGVHFLWTVVEPFVDEIAIIMHELTPLNIISYWLSVWITDYGMYIYQVVCLQ